jgi:hypothetical protein
MDVQLIPLVFLGIMVVVLAGGIGHGLRRYRRRQFIDGYRFPLYLAAKLREARPGLSHEQEALVFDGLRQYFHACRLANGRFVSMPSKAVDDAWHAFILSTRAYRDFCARGFGRFLHHTPAEAMRTPTLAGEGIRRAWRLCCTLEKVDPRAPAALPLLFAVDQALAIADGYRYDLACTPASGTYCASHIGCSSGCGGGCSGDSSADGGGDGGGCGGGD